MTSTSTSTTGPITTLNPNVIVATKALVKSVSELIGLQTKVNDKFASTADFLRKEADEKGIDSKGANVLLQSAYKGAYEQMAERDGLSNVDAPLFVKRMLDKSAPDRSKMIRLAFPTDDKAGEEAKAAREKGYGLNAQLECARGNTTVAELDQKRTEASSKAARPKDGSTPAAPAPVSSAQAEANAAIAQGLKPDEKFGNAVAALYALGKGLGISAEGQLELVTNYYAEVAAKEGSESVAK